MKFLSKSFEVLFAAQIASDPILFEPMYLVDITVPQPALSGVYQTLNARRGEVESMQERVGTPLVQIRAFLPDDDNYFLPMTPSRVQGYFPSPITSTTLRSNSRFS